MKIRKHIISITAAILLLVACGGKNVQIEMPQDSPVEEETAAGVEETAIDQSVTDEWHYLPVKDFPITDSTSFNCHCYSEADRIGYSDAEMLNLLSLSGEAAYYAPYRINFSDKFTSVVIIAERENEMEAFLVNLDNDNHIIDKLPITYDDIVESISPKHSIITQKRITVIQKYFDAETDTPSVETTHYAIDENGHFLKQD
ncbi:MAG: hypothetical protein LBR34_03785 [Prevotella sp.]|jgi:hypothetical protein|nr:hypothetical protein [Prevotella sp.]